MKITYAHAISNPFLTVEEERAKGIKPFELREVSAELFARRDGDDWEVWAVVDNEKMPEAYNSDIDAATKDAIQNASIYLMEQSQKPWR